MNLTIKSNAISIGIQTRLMIKQNDIKKSHMIFLWPFGSITFVLLLYLLIQ